MAPEPPIFLVGWFRSGTTMFWNMFRESGSYTCYYEPLHEHLPLYVEKGHVYSDPTHDGVLDYWSEYRALQRDGFTRLWRPWFGRERWMLGRNDAAPDLKAYIDFLIESAPQRPVLKFVRAGFRSEWLREHFPRARIIHIVRDPRAVWSSMMGRDCECDSDPGRMSDSAASWLRMIHKLALELSIPLQSHPYQLFYLLWCRMFRQVAAAADTTWCYEDAINGADAWVHDNLLVPAFLDAMPRTPISRRSLQAGLHTRAWYWEKEATVDAVSTSAPGPTSRERDLVRDLRLLEDRYERLFVDTGNLNLDYLRSLEGHSRESRFFLCLAALKTMKNVVKLLIGKRVG